jgi:hypothetical protein
MEEHRHAEDGSVILVDTPEAVEVQEQPAAVEDITAAEVRIAEIQAKRDVELAKLSVRADEQADSSELDELRGEVRALREMVELLRGPEPDPEPEPAPVVIEADPEPDPVAEEPPPPVENKPAPKPRTGPSWF